MAKSYQVFVGCPFLPAIRKNYDKLKNHLEKETPLRIVLADTMTITSTDNLLDYITELIRDSAACIFDVTGGNPNVSLEVGIAHAMPADFLLALYTRKPRTQRVTQHALEKAGEVKPIISDLQGRIRIEYKTYKTLKDDILSRYLDSLPYMRRWNDFRRRNASFVRPALQIFSEIRGAAGRTIRPRVIAMLDGTGIDADALLVALSHSRLLTVRRGRTGGIYYPAD